MEDNNKIVIITNANMNLQSGDVTLILRRAKAIYELTGMHTTCLLLKNHGIVKDNEGITFKYISMDKKAVKDILETIKPKKVIFFGIRSYKFISVARQVSNKIGVNTELICDIQGVPEEVIEFTRGINKICMFPIYLYKKLLFIQGIKKADGAFIVSTEMKKYVKNLLPLSKQIDYEFYKVRCGINTLLNSNQKIKWRETIRRELGIDKHTHIFVFSGYRMPWQKVEDMLEIFKHYDKNGKDIFFALFCNIDDDFERKIKNMFPKKNYILKFLDSEEYYPYLCACDVGFLLRDNKVTNSVAFPNKFSDYLNAGLMVAMNENVCEPFEILENHRIEYINTKDIMDIEKIMHIIDNRKSKLDEYYLKLETMCKEELNYENQIKKEFMRQR